MKAVDRDSEGNEEIIMDSPARTDSEGRNEAEEGGRGEDTTPDGAPQVTLAGAPEPTPTTETPTGESCVGVHAAAGNCEHGSSAGKRPRCRFTTTPG